MRRVPIAATALILGLLAFVANVALLVLRSTDSATEAGMSDAVAWLAPLAGPMATIAIVFGFLSLLTERIGDAFPKHARAAVILGTLALACRAIVTALA